MDSIQSFGIVNNVSTRETKAGTETKVTLTVPSDPRLMELVGKTVKVTVEPVEQDVD